MSCAALLIAGIVFAGGPFSPLGLVLIPVGLIGGGSLAEAVARIVHRRDLARWSAAGDTVNWVRVHDRVVLEFRASIQRSRTSLLEPSPRSVAHRQQLLRGLDEAGQSVRFWREAAENQPDSEANRTQLQTAEELERKLQHALDGLDRRRERLAAFLDQCEAKATELEFSRLKLEESNRLTSLAEQASSAISGAEASVERLGEEFLAEAARGFAALGGLERLHLSEMAGNLSVSSIEDVADEIVSSAEEEERALGELTRALNE